MIKILMASTGASVTADADTFLITWWKNLKIKINRAKVSLLVGEDNRAIDGEISIRRCP